MAFLLPPGQDGVASLQVFASLYARLRRSQPTGLCVSHTNRLKHKQTITHKTTTAPAPPPPPRRLYPRVRAPSPRPNHPLPLGRGCHDHHHHNGPKEGPAPAGSRGMFARLVCLLLSLWCARGSWLGAGPTDTRIHTRYTHTHKHTLTHTYIDSLSLTHNIFYTYHTLTAPPPPPPGPLYQHHPPLLPKHHPNNPP